MRQFTATLLATSLLHPKPPFHFAGTFHKPSHFPSRDNSYENERYWQTMNLSGRPFGLHFSPLGGPNPSVELQVYGEGALSVEDLKRIETEVIWRFDLATDLQEFDVRFIGDDLLGPALHRWHGMRVSCAYSLYELLIVTVVLQNATVRRSVQMLDSLFARFGTLISFAGRDLYAFWTPQEAASVDESELRALRLGYRAKTIARLTEAFDNSWTANEYDLRAMPKAEIRRELLKLYGIGPASVGTLLFELFHKYDAFDTISPWEQKIYSKLLFGEDAVPSDRILEMVRARWGDWRMLASHYIFEDLFWQRRTRNIPWLEELIRL